MPCEPKINNVGHPGREHLTVWFIDNAVTVLGQVFDFAIAQRDVPFATNPARGIQLPKQDRRETHYLRDRNAYPLQHRRGGPVRPAGTADGRQPPAPAGLGQ